MNSETFGEKIRRLRLKNQLALRQLAAEIDFDQSTLSKVERNEVIAPQRIIRNLAKLLKQDYREFQIKYLSERIFYELKGMDYASAALGLVERRLEEEHAGTTSKLRKASLINKIKKYLSKQPVIKAWLFGSFARSEESLDSDIDILVRFKKSNKIDLFDYVGMIQDLEDITGRQIDLVEEGHLIPSAEKNVDKEKILIYEGNGG